MGAADAVAEFPVGAKLLLAESELREYAASLWSELPEGAVLWLTGDLGAGKTAFAKAITAVAAGELARSPTFALVHEYTCPGGLIVHVDCYRLREPSEALDLDFPGLLRRARLVVVEWPERGGPLVPVADAHVAFAHGDEAGKRWLERIV